MLKWRLVTYIGFLKQSWYYLFCKKCVRGLAPFRKGFPMQISISIIIFAMAVILAGSCIQSALGNYHDHDGISSTRDALQQGHGTLDYHGEHQYTLYFNKIPETYPLGGYASGSDPDRYYLRNC